MGLSEKKIQRDCGKKHHFGCSRARKKIKIRKCNLEAIFALTQFTVVSFSLLWFFCPKTWVFFAAQEFFGLTFWLCKSSFCRRKWPQKVTFVRALKSLNFFFCSQMCLQTADFSDTPSKLWSFVLEFSEAVLGLDHFWWCRGPEPRQSDIMWKVKKLENSEPSNWTSGEWARNWNWRFWKELFFDGIGEVCFFVRRQFVGMGSC